MNYKQHIRKFDKEYFHGGHLSNYDNYDWEHFRGVLKDYAEAILFDYLPNDKITTIMDAGCAKGYLVKILLEMGYDAYGFDVSDFAIEDGVQEYPMLKDRLFVQDITTYHPFQTYDLVICAETLEHIDPKRSRAAITNIADATNKYAILSMPFERYEGDTDTTHINFKSRKEWESIILEFFDYVPGTNTADLDRIQGMWNFFPLIKKGL